MSTHVIIFTMNSTTLLIKFYYYKKSLNKNNSLFIQDIDIETNTIINPLQIV